MPFLQWTDGQKKMIDAPLGADFLQTIQAIQSVSQGFQDYKKTPAAKIHAAIERYLTWIQEQQDSSLFTAREKAVFASKTQKILTSNRFTLPVGPSLIYGSRSSPLLRMISVLHALSQQCTVFFLCNSFLADTYLLLFEKLAECGFPSSALCLLTTKDPESLETLVSHPSLKAIHFMGHAYEGEFLKKNPLPLFQKRIKIHFGSKNPVIFTHDADLSRLQTMLHESLQTHFYSEHQFNRWFVQEKNYSTFVESIEKLLPLAAESLTNTFSADVDYLENLQRQNTSLMKEKNWKTSAVTNFLFNPDFNNCSPWHQQETLGSLLTITRYKNSSEAIKFANTTQYACASAVFASTAEKAKDISSQLIMPHHYMNVIPDLENSDALLGLPGCGFGNEVSDEQFFNYCL